MAKNTSLHSAKRAKQDEYYTRLEDIENELRHYKSHFRGKTVFCNCDDPYESNFFKYFALNFNVLGLKKLISVSYAGSPVAGKEYGLFEASGIEMPITEKRAYKVVMTELRDVTGDGRESLEDVQAIIRHRIRYLEGDGDFRSPESAELLKQADIVVTNPPFSLFREYIALLIEYRKQFLVIGSMNAITYKEIFPLIKDNLIWLGYGFKAGNAFFSIPAYEDVASYASGVYDENTKLVKFRNCHWFTNLDHDKRHEPLVLYKEYTPEEYPRYDNYNAINVDKVAEIPVDYHPCWHGCPLAGECEFAQKEGFDTDADCPCQKISKEALPDFSAVSPDRTEFTHTHTQRRRSGIMGVPVTFLDKYCPRQFEIIGNEYTLGIEKGRGYINGKRMYSRLFIRTKM